MKKTMIIINNIISLSLGLAACESQSILSQVDANSQTATKTSTNSTTATASKQAANIGGRPGQGALVVDPEVDKADRNF